MILLGATYKNEDFIEYKVYGSNKVQFLKNALPHRDAIYKFKDPEKGAEKDLFMIIFSGNRETLIDGLKYQIAHYILLKEKENSKYLIDVEMFNTLFTKTN